MNVLKLALLGTAAVAAVSVSARADDLSDLKAQIEALNGRIATLEQTPSVPAGYQLLSVSDAPAIVNAGFEDRRGLYSAKATNIAILPTADVPASTNIQWSGFARAALVYSDVDYETGNSTDVGGVATTLADDDSIDILSRAEIKVVGTTDTAVGEVGVQVKVRANFEGVGNGDAVMPDGTYGWWKMTPELMLSAGYNGSLSNIGYGYDGACTCYYTDNAPVALNPGDRTQMRLTYASGPISFAVALEDSDVDDIIGAADDSLGAAAEMKYSGDAFSAEISAGYWDGDSAPSDAYQVGVGMDFSLGDSAKISMAAGLGQQFDDGEYVKASILGSVNLSDSVHAEIAFGYADFDDITGLNAPFVGGVHDVEVMSVLGGIYYDPVSQLTIGLEAEYQTWDSNAANQDVEAFSADLVTVFRF